MLHPLIQKVGPVGALGCTDLPASC